MYFGVQTYYTLKVSHTAFLLKTCKVVLIKYFWTKWYYGRRYFIAITKISCIHQTGKRYMAMHLVNAISYITDEEKTQSGALVGSGF